MIGSEFNINYIDSVLIVDKNMNIVHTNRYNPRFSHNKIENEYTDYIFRKYNEVYPNIRQDESTIIECLKTGRVIYRDRQKFSDLNGNIYITRNITYPIIRYGEIVGALEISQDITTKNTIESSEGRLLNNDPAENQYTKHTDKSEIITRNHHMMEMIRRAKIFSFNSSPVLIFGETGTGKELYVEAMVRSNPNLKGEYLTVNCAAIPETLFESILFGSTKGAFTGAEDKKGLFELANNGVLFLDELNSMPVSLQPKLLRVLQNGRVRPMGSSKEVSVNVKVIAAVNKDPRYLMEQRQLREDLFYRLSSNMIELLPLRDRVEDIDLYINYFIEKANLEYGKNITKVSKSLNHLLNKYSWPGNVREIKHVVESMVNLTEGNELTVGDLPFYLKDHLNQNTKDQSFSEELDRDYHLEPLNTYLNKMESNHIEKALKLTSGNITKAAEILGMPRQTLKYRIDKLNMLSK